MSLPKTNAISDQDSAQGSGDEDLHLASVQESAHQMKHWDVVGKLAYMLNLTERRGAGERRTA